MEINKQVCSLNLAKQLKELGVKQESLWYWERMEDVSDYSLVLSESFGNDVEHLHYPCYSAYTVAELIGLLPYSIAENGTDFYLSMGKFYCGYYSTEADTWEMYIPDGEGERLVELFFDEKGLNHSLALMLIFLLENDIIKVEDLESEADGE